jgi:hypothetical protein
MTKHEHTRRFADKGAKAGREFVERRTWEAEEATKEARQNFSSSVASIRELNIMLIEMAHDKAEAVFDLAHEIASVQAPADLMAIWSAHARRQFEMMTNHTVGLTELGQKLARHSTEPVTRAFTRGE